MAIDNVEVVDFSGVDKESGEIRLTISDHLDWSDEREKLEILVAKLNAYVKFITSGQVYEAHPDQRDGAVSIGVFCLHRPPKSVAGNLLNIRNQLRSQGIGFKIVLGPYESGVVSPYEFVEA